MTLFRRGTDAKKEEAKLKQQQEEREARYAIGMKALKENDPLQPSIDLSSQWIQVDGARTVADALRTNTTVRVLNLRYNSFGLEGVRMLADALNHNKTLEELNLAKNSLRDTAVKPLADALRSNTTLKRLNLAENVIGDEGVVALAEALRNNTTLESLSLSGNQIHDAGVQALAELIRQNAPLKYLDLSGNPFFSDGAFALVDALRVNTNLQGLSLRLVRPTSTSGPNKPTGTLTVHGNPARACARTNSPAPRNRSPGRSSSPSRLPAEPDPERTWLFASASTDSVDQHS